jgi:hypothetical protein
MGVKALGESLYKISGLSLGAIFRVARFVAPTQERKANPTVFIDTSWIVRILNTSGTPCVSKTRDFAVVLCNLGFEVIFVYDPAGRHHAKADSIRRRGVVEGTRITACKAKREVMRLAKLRSDQQSTLTLQETKKIDEDIKSLNAKARAGDNDEKRQLPARFFEQLYMALKDIEPSSVGGSVNVITDAEFQADSVIAKAVVDGRVDILMANDGDFAIYGGDRYLALVDFKWSAKAKSLDKINKVEIRMVSSKIFNKIKDDVLVPHEQNTTKCDSPTDGSLLDGLCPRKRCMVAVALGCDQCPKGIPGRGAKSVHAVLDSFLNEEKMRQSDATFSDEELE